MSVWQRSISLIPLVGWLLFSNSATLPAGLEKIAAADTSLTAETLLTNLPDKNYQFCTEPDPQDWRDGAGVCLNFVKQGVTVDGYYGYPHSGNFVCLRGEVSGDWLQGEGLAISWFGQTWSDIFQEEFTWDSEGRLFLSQGEVMHHEGMGEDQASWIIFEQASLNMQGMHSYPEPRMTSPSQLCNWAFD
ncbi:MAG: hypothetical protein F6J95_030205 [Leptolyngbya sp. SIO1E4]|nr:hypothetical protein [Leptolyngbya sp. SIO1E4]